MNLRKDHYRRFPSRLSCAGPKLPVLGRAMEVPAWCAVSSAESVSPRADRRSEGEGQLPCTPGRLCSRLLRVVRSPPRGEGRTFESVSAGVGIWSARSNESRANRRGLRPPGSLTPFFFLPLRSSRKGSRHLSPQRSRQANNKTRNNCRRWIARLPRR